MSKTTILIIDDEPSNIQVIINLLQNSGKDYKVLSSTNSSLGLEIAVQTLPDIIITNWHMPGLNGIEVIQELKKNVDTKEIPVIMASGVNMNSSDLKLALDSGAYDFIRKPIDSNELLARINSALKLVKYYKDKVETDKNIAVINYEKSITEIETQKREIIAQTMLLIQVKELNEQLYNKLLKIDRNQCNANCQIFNISNVYIKDVFNNNSDQIWNELELNFEQINENFYKNLVIKFPNISHNERKLCAYLRLKLSTKEIAAITFQTIRSIEIARTRLREKLGIKGTDEDLHSFLLSF
ncbi:MAG: hypothetical protein A2046_05140 [Bacteroidetes bacterium GWA2_30_7]|nr:MAG: hypothetical protein A2046_05140 [Bacteroidetes bacterium GWA2_30_7]